MEELVIGDAAYAADDRRQVNELAQLICKSPTAVTQLVAFCKQQAADILSEHLLAAKMLTTLLKARREIDGADEIDRVIAVALAGEAAVLERMRRHEWNARIELAKQFTLTVQRDT